MNPSPALKLFNYVKSEFPDAGTEDLRKLFRQVLKYIEDPQALLGTPPPNPFRRWHQYERTGKCHNEKCRKPTQSKFCSIQCSRLFAKRRARARAKCVHTWQIFGNFFVCAKCDALRRMPSDGPGPG